MSKPDAAKKLSASPQVADLPTAEMLPEGLDKVRDILFGTQMRAVESRLQRMEERLREEDDAIRADLSKRTETLEALVRSEVHKLEERLSEERTRRVEEIKSLAAEIKESIRTLEKRHAQLEEDANIADAALRDQLLVQSRDAAAELAKLDERLTAELSRSHQELNSAKTDRTTLAALLTDVASQLGGPPVPAPEKSGPGS